MNSLPVVLQDDALTACSNASQDKISNQDRTATTFVALGKKLPGFIAGGLNDRLARMQAWTNRNWGGIAVKIADGLRHSRVIDAAMRIAARGISPVISAYRRIVLPYEVRSRPVLRIHFGCGEANDPRFFNVDARPFRHVHYVTSSPLMPALQARSADLIYACHVFEHISYRLQLDVLRRWHRLLKPGGEILLSVPDFARIVDVYMRGGFCFDQIQSFLMGGQNYPGNVHFALFTPDHLTELLLKAGFCNIREWHPRDQENWPRDWSWAETISLNLRAEKP